MASTATWKIALKSQDGGIFEISEAVAMESLTIKNMIENDGIHTVVLTVPATAKILTKVIDYCRMHASAENGGDAETLKTWDAELVDVDQATLFDMFFAASYLDIKNLVELTSQTIADVIQGKSLEEIYTTFNIN